MFQLIYLTTCVGIFWNSHFGCKVLWPSCVLCNRCLKMDLENISTNFSSSHKSLMFCVIKANFFLLWVMSYCKRGINPLSSQLLYGLSICNLELVAPQSFPLFRCVCLLKLILQVLFFTYDVFLSLLCSFIVLCKVHLSNFMFTYFFGDKFESSHNMFIIRL